MRGLLFRAVCLGALLSLSGLGAEQSLRPAQPNILLIVADDMGFSDLGCYGSEILTPHLDRLGREGLRFTQFYNTARCCPTRAALMTGLYPHQVGVGHMMADWRRPGYRGDLSQDCATIAEALKAAGYQTMMCGKWHVTRHTGPDGPKYNWPISRGFERFFGTIEGGGDYFNPITLTRDNQFSGPTGDFYYTDAISEHAAEYVEQARRVRKPFFLYVAYTAPHWPLHARPEDIRRYQGKYAMGWDALREQRREQMIRMGIVKAQWPLAPRDRRVDAWHEVPHKQWHQRRMEVYAAQIDCMDRGIGRILQKLAQIGAEENTLVLFLSDNGGCAEEIAATWRNPVIPDKTRDGQTVQVGNDPNILPGPATTYQSCGTPWANVSNTPFRLYKHWVHEGGVATPLIAYWPTGIRQPGRLVHEPGHVIDIMATCLEVAGVDHPTLFGGRKMIPLEGKSLLPLLLGKTRQRGPIFWEHEGNRAIRDGTWKLVSRHPGQWELYDLEADRTEMNDLAEKHPQIVQAMTQQYDAWAKRCQVEPWGQLPGGATGSRQRAAGSKQ